MSVVNLLLILNQEKEIKSTNTAPPTLRSSPCFLPPPPQKYSKDQRVPTQPTAQVPLGKSHPKGERMWLINGMAQFCPYLNF